MGTGHGSDSDDVGMMRAVGRLALGLSDHVPGSRFVRRQMEDAERMALSHLKSRLDKLEDDRPFQPEAGLTEPAPSAKRTSRRRLSLAERFAQMVEQSLEQTPESALDAYFGQLLGEMVPDEVRLLNAASDGSRIPVVHVDVGSRLSGSQRVMAYLSRSGNESGVMRNELTPYYLAHLVGIGLFEDATEDKSAITKYEMIESDSDVRKALERLQKERSGKPRTVRASLVLSRLGRDFLSRCNAQD